MSCTIHTVSQNWPLDFQPTRTRSMSRGDSSISQKFVHTYIHSPHSTIFTYVQYTQLQHDYSHVSKLLLDQNPSHCLDRTVPVELGIITMNSICVHIRDAQPLKTESTNTFASKRYHSIVLGNIKTFTSQISWFVF